MAMPTNIMWVNLDFDISFDEVIKDKQTWDNNNVTQVRSASVWYTDASYSENKTKSGDNVPQVNPYRLLSAIL